MQAVFKRLAVVTVPPDGEVHDLYTPPQGGCGVIGKITIVSCWATPEAQGFLPTGMLLGRDGPKLWRQGSPYVFGPGFRANGQDGWVLTAGAPNNVANVAPGGKHHHYWYQGGQHGAVLSLYQLLVQNCPVADLSLSPLPPTSHVITPGLTLGAGQSLQCVNGIIQHPVRNTNFGGNTITLENNNRREHIADNRRRSPSLVISLFGQEFRG